MSISCYYPVWDSYTWLISFSCYISILNYFEHFYLVLCFTPFHYVSLVTFLVTSPCTYNLRINLSMFLVVLWFLPCHSMKIAPFVIQIITLHSLLFALCGDIVSTIIYCILASWLTQPSQAWVEECRIRLASNVKLNHILQI